MQVDASSYGQSDVKLEGKFDHSQDRHEVSKRVRQNFAYWYKRHLADLSGMCQFVLLQSGWFKVRLVASWMYAFEASFCLGRALGG